MRLTLEQWFEIVCDDLDPERKWKRPTWTQPSQFDFLMSGGKHLGAFDHREKSIWLCNCEDFDLQSYKVLAHELRHWFQCYSGMLQDFYSQNMVIVNSYSARWRGERGEWVVSDSDEYKQLPWEADANEYAAEVCARLLPQYEVA